MYNLGGIVGALSFAWWISRIGSRIPQLCATTASIVSALLLRAMYINPTQGTPYVILAIAMHGLFVNAVQTTMYALASHLYTTRVRPTGVAAALAIGRVGAIASAFLGVHLMHAGKNIYFQAIALSMTLVLVSLALMRNHIGTQPDPS
jgi:AAHS family 4-hydroxybenzoate transporter-like MFS transporter